MPVDEVRRCLTAIFGKQPENDRAHAVAALFFRRLNDERRALSHYAGVQEQPAQHRGDPRVALAVMRRREASAEDGEMSPGSLRLGLG